MGDVLLAHSPGKQRTRIPAVALIVVLSALALTTEAVGLWHLIGVLQDSSVASWLEEKGEAPFRIYAACYIINLPPDCLPDGCVIINPNDCP